MANVLIFICMTALLVLCGLMTIIILMQKPSANAGMGAALGGGAAESVFGGETANVLLKYTIRIAVAFFVLSFLLYLGILAHNRPVESAGANLPSLGLPNKPAASAPAASAKATSAPAASADATGLKLPPVFINNVLTPAPAPASGSAPAPAASSAVAPAPASSAAPSSAPAN